MAPDSSPIPESSQESVDHLLCHSQEREALAAMMAADDEALWKREKKASCTSTSIVIHGTDRGKLFQQEAEDGEWEPSSSQKSDDVDEEFPYTSSQESGQSLDEEASYTASQSTSAYSDSEETIHVDSSLTRRLGAPFSPKLTGKLVLFLARKRRAFIDRGKYGPVEMFLDKMFDCREFRHLSRQQLTIIHKFITRHKVMEEGGDDWTAAELERELRMEWESLRDDTCLWQSE